MRRNQTGHIAGLVLAYMIVRIFSQYKCLQRAEIKERNDNLSVIPHQPRPKHTRTCTKSMKIVLKSIDYFESPIERI